MKKKIIKIICFVLFALLILWSIMYFTDYTRCKSLKNPIFAVPSMTDSYGDGVVWDGLGYSIMMFKSSDGSTGERYTEELSLSLFKSGVIRVLYNDGEIEVKKLNWSSGINFPWQRRSKPKVSESEGFYNLFGIDKSVIERNLDLGEVVPEIDGHQEIYSYICDENKKAITQKDLIFYNDVLMGTQFRFDDVEKAYYHCKELRVNLEHAFGEKTTYPSMTLTNKECFDNIGSASQLKEKYVYYEDWTPEIDKDVLQIEKMMDGRAYSRIDIRFELSVLSEDNATVSVRYVALP